MDIHEYQAKEILRRFGVTVPRGGVAHSVDQALQRARQVGGSRWAVKAQVHSGARGKAGGIKLCSSEAEISAAASALLGKRLVTDQTGPRGKPTACLYVEAATEFGRELYLAMVIDRKAQRVMIVASSVGGVDIEHIAASNPSSIVRRLIDPSAGIQPFEAREIALALNLESDLIGRAAETILGVYRAFREVDASMLEINPLAISKDRRLIALDCKMSLDENALFRRPEFAELRDKSQEDPRETYANDRGLAYVGLDGHIGCIINGAGLAMATMDMIKLAGGEPANFLDIGGGASPDRVATSFRSVLSDPKVEVVLVNIFAGINRCDWVAEGVVKAIEEVGVRVPLIVRLAGTNVEKGTAILQQSGHHIITAETLAEAAEKAVAAWRNGRAQKTEGDPAHVNSARPGHKDHRAGLHRPDRVVSR